MQTFQQTLQPLPNEVGLLIRFLMAFVLVLYQKKCAETLCTNLQGSLKLVLRCSSPRGSAPAPSLQGPGAGGHHLVFGRPDVRCQLHAMIQHHSIYSLCIVYVWSMYSGSIQF